MDYYDVLLSTCWEGSADKSWYFVYTIEAKTKPAAIAKAKVKNRAFFKEQGIRVLYQTAHGAGPTGCYQGFAGKYVGQFIDEAFAG